MPQTALRVYRSQSAFVLLLKLADRRFGDQGFEDALTDRLRDKATLIELSETWSADQRWTPSAFVEENKVGWYDGGRQYVRVHPERGEPVDPGEHASGIVHEPGYLRRAANGHLLSRAIRHGATGSWIGELELPSNMSVIRAERSPD